jgi:hypothetical protein
MVGLAEYLRSIESEDFLKSLTWMTAVELSRILCSSRSLISALPKGSRSRIYPQQTVLNASAKQLVVTTTNSNYQRLGG